nr:GNAT family protein [Angustibacter aerolatus]
MRTGCCCVAGGWPTSTRASRCTTPSRPAGHRRCSSTPASLVAERLQAEVAQEHDPEPPATLAIAAADDPDRLLGSMDWRNGFPAPFSIRDVGYAVAPEARGRGVASTALRLITEWLLDPTGGDVVRVQARPRRRERGVVPHGPAGGVPRRGGARALPPAARVPRRPARHARRVHARPGASAPLLSPADAGPSPRPGPRRPGGGAGTAP